MKNLRQNKNFRVFVFTMFSSSIVVLGMYLSYLAGLGGTIAVISTSFLIPVLNGLSKFINVYYFNDIGVEK